MLVGVLAVIAVIVAVSGLLPLLNGLRAGTSIATRTRSARGPKGRLRAHDALIAVQVALGVVLVTGSISALGEYRAAADFDRLGFRWHRHHIATFGTATFGIATVGVAPLAVGVGTREGKRQGPGLRRHGPLRRRGRKGAREEKEQSEDSGGPAHGSGSRRLDQHAAAHLHVEGVAEPLAIEPVHARPVGDERGRGGGLLS